MRSLMADLNSFWQRSVNAQRGRLYADGPEVKSRLESLSRLTSGYCGWLAQPSEAVVAERHNGVTLIA